MTYNSIRSTERLLEISNNFFLLSQSKSPCMYPLLPLIKPKIHIVIYGQKHRPAHVPWSLAVFTIRLSYQTNELIIIIIIITIILEGIWLCYDKGIILWIYIYIYMPLSPLAFFWHEDKSHKSSSTQAFMEILFFLYQINKQIIIHKEVAIPSFCQAFLHLLFFFSSNSINPVLFL